MRAGTVSAGVALMMVMSSPAFALIKDDGDDPGPGQSLGETLGLFVGIPLLAFLVIAGIAQITDKNRSKKN
jgi:hypothetical protein